MRYAIFSDVHANLEALEAVLKDLQKEQIDRFLSLGDIVGYGPDPNECVKLIRTFVSIAMLGNHDLAALGLEDISSFNPDARKATRWTRSRLTPISQAYLRNLPLISQINKLYLVHATPYKPEAWNYLATLQDARFNFKYFKQQICLVGHSHVPVIIEEEKENCRINPATEVVIKEGTRYLINVGSVGQPRDGNPDACYAIYDTNDSRFQIRRVKYDVTSTQKKMSLCGLPPYLATRLALGQ